MTSLLCVQIHTLFEFWYDPEEEWEAHIAKLQLWPNWVSLQLLLAFTERCLTQEFDLQRFHVSANTIQFNQKYSKLSLKREREIGSGKVEKLGNYSISRWDLLNQHAALHSSEKTKC